MSGRQWLGMRGPEGYVCGGVRPNAPGWPGTVSIRVSVRRAPLNVHEPLAVAVRPDAELPRVPDAVYLDLDVRALVERVDVGFLGHAWSIPAAADKGSHDKGAAPAGSGRGDASGRRQEEVRAR
jgi:hypothetical protein